MSNAGIVHCEQPANVAYCVRSYADSPFSRQVLVVKRHSVLLECRHSSERPQLTRSPPVGKEGLMAAITCTNCGAVLKTKDPIPPGKKVKCPKCMQAFVVQDEGQESVAAPPSKEIQAAPKSGGMDLPAPKKPKSKAEDVPAEDQAAEDDDGSAKKGKGGDAPKKNNTMLIAIIVGVFLVCCCCPTTCGGVWQFFADSIAKTLGVTTQDAIKKQIDDELKKKK